MGRLSFNVTPGSKLDTETMPAKEIARRFFMAIVRSKVEERRLIVGDGVAEREAQEYASALLKDAFPEWWTSWSSRLVGPLG